MNSKILLSWYTSSRRKEATTLSMFLMIHGAKYTIMLSLSIKITILVLPLCLASIPNMKYKLADVQQSVDIDSGFGGAL